MSGVLSLAHTLNYDDPDRQRMLSFTVSSGYIFFQEVCFHSFKSIWNCVLHYQETVSKFWIHFLSGSMLS